MARSILLDVRQAVIDGIAQEVDVSVACTYGWQGSEDNARRDQIFTANGRATHESAALKSGRNFRNERMEFDLVILCLGVSQKPEEVDAHAMDLAQTVEEFIADHKGGEGFGITGLNWLVVSGMQLQNRYGTDGSLSEITYTLTYDARLT